MTTTDIIHLSHTTAAVFCALSNMGFDEHQIAKRMPTTESFNPKCSAMDYACTIGAPWIEDSDEAISDEVIGWIVDRASVKIAADRLTKLGYPFKVVRR